MRHPIRGLLIGPLVAPIAYWIGMLVYVWVRDSGVSVSEALRHLALITAFGLPIAYAAAFAWGAPVLYLLHRLGWLRAWTVIVAGAVGGTFVALLFTYWQQGSLFKVHMPLPGGAVLGALVGGVCWWAGQGKAGHHVPVT